MPISLTVRRDPIGEGFLDRVNNPGKNISLGRRLLVVFIHGFNVRQDDAIKSYDQFVKNISNNELLKYLSKKICTFFWPGNIRNKIFSVFSYPTQVKNALKTSELLYEFLKQQHGPNGSPTEVIFLAHSLGCRIAIETAVSLNRSTNSHTCRVTKICLMAAAVSVDKLRIPSEYDKVIKQLKIKYNLFSTNDLVLYAAFPIGQTLAGEGYFPQAIGFSGMRDYSWTIKPTNTGLDHGEYWKDKNVSNYFSQMFSIQFPRKILDAKISERILPSRNI